MQSLSSSSPGAWSSNTAAPILPLADRSGPIHFVAPDGNVGCTAYPINYDEVYNLKGRLLTLADATFTDPQQRKAFKDIVWQTLRDWMTDIESSQPAGYDPPSGEAS